LVSRGRGGKRQKLVTRIKGRCRTSCSPKPENGCRHPSTSSEEGKKKERAHLLITRRQEKKRKPWRIAAGREIILSPNRRKEGRPIYWCVKFFSLIKRGRPLSAKKRKKKKEEIGPSNHQSGRNLRSSLQCGEALIGRGGVGKGNRDYDGIAPGPQEDQTVSWK